MKHVVVIGGGNGSAKTIRACGSFIDRIHLSAVVAMSDSGGSSGRLREEFNTLPAGDVLRAILAMSEHDYRLLKKMFYSHRFDGVGELDNHNLGNLFLVLAERYAGSFLSACRALEQAVDARGHVHPATLDLTQLAVELDTGEKMIGEHLIDRPENERSAAIMKAWLEPAGKANEQACRLIGAADYILLGPGSLYCSIVAALLPDGIREAIEASAARLIFIAGNAYEVEGEWGPTRLSDMVRELELYLPRRIDHIIYNNAKLNADQEQWYREKKWKLFEADFENMKEYDVIQGDYERDERAGLSDYKLGALLGNIIA